MIECVIRQRTGTCKHVLCPLGRGCMDVQGGLCEDGEGCLAAPASWDQHTKCPYSWPRQDTRVRSYAENAESQVVAHIQHSLLC